MQIRRATLYVKVDGEEKEVAPCHVDMVDGGVFAVPESERAKGGTLTWKRLGTVEGLGGLTFVAGEK